MNVETEVPERDRNGLMMLSREESLRLLAGASIGRVGLCMHALPTVLPVSFALDGDTIVIRTGTGSKLEAAMHNAVVAFEVDQIDSVYHEGWSVVVTGVARAVTDPAEIDRMERLPLLPWSIVPGDALVTIE